MLALVSFYALPSGGNRKTRWSIGNKNSTNCVNAIFTGSVPVLNCFCIIVTDSAFVWTTCATAITNDHICFGMSSANKKPLSSLCLSLSLSLSVYLTHTHTLYLCPLLTKLRLTSLNRNKWCHQISVDVTGRYLLIGLSAAPTSKLRCNDFGSLVITSTLNPVVKGSN